MAKLLYQGHGSFRLVSEKGTVVYVDPYVGEGYDMEADLVLVTHEHHDHNAVELVTVKEGGRVLRAADMLEEGRYQTRVLGDITVHAVPAYNKNHDRSACVGYLIGVDHKRIYAAGDTSTTDFMEKLAGEHLDYALLPIDGVYNMDSREASRCAEIIQAKHAIPIHMKPGQLFDRAAAETFRAEGRIILEPGESITLE